MKFDRYKAFPYPVLRPHSDDYTDAEFQTTVEFSVGNEKVIATVDYAISAEAIVEQIHEGNAEYVSVVSCRDTYFRSVLRSNETKFEAQFNTAELRGEVKVDSYVVVKKKIVSFMSTDINEEFGVGPFSFEAGEILAQDETQVFYIERDLFKPVTSVFDLVKNENLSEGEWTVSFEDNHIQIGVSPKMKEVIDDARNEKKNRIILSNSIYFAAVTQAVQNLKTSPGEWEGKRWAEIISRQAHNKGYDIDTTDAYLIAQRLMQHPLSLLDLYVFKGNANEGPTA